MRKKLTAIIFFIGMIIVLIQCVKKQDPSPQAAAPKCSNTCPLYNGFDIGPNNLCNCKPYDEWYDTTTYSFGVHRNKIQLSDSSTTDSTGYVNMKPETFLTYPKSVEFIDSNSTIVILNDVTPALPNYEGDISSYLNIDLDFNNSTQIYSNNNGQLAQLTAANLSNLHYTLNSAVKVGKFYNVNVHAMVLPRDFYYVNSTLTFTYNNVNYHYYIKTIIDAYTSN
jgi:hypothetical protein